MVFFFQIEALLSLKNAWLSPVFFLGINTAGSLTIYKGLAR